MRYEKFMKEGQIILIVLLHLFTFLNLADAFIERDKIQCNNYVCTYLFLNLHIIRAFPKPILRQVSKPGLLLQPQQGSTKKSYAFFLLLKKSIKLVIKK